MIVLAELMAAIVQNKGLEVPRIIDRLVWSYYQSHPAGKTKYCWNSLRKCVL